MVSEKKKKMVSGKTIVSTAASIVASAMVIGSITNDLVPREIREYIFSTIKTFLRSFSDETILIIVENDGLGSNQIYKAAEIYLGSKTLPSMKTFMISMPEKQTKISTKMAENQQVIDNFNGVQLKWRKITSQVQSSKYEKRFYELSFQMKHQKMVIDSYLPFILHESKKIKEDSKILKIHTVNDRCSSGRYAWSSIKLDHPSTFDTLAMDDDLKKTIVDDLERFVKRREYYRNVGKAWKRGYLLYGPPGTGKSSLIAAMANYLKFDIYDLELTDIHSNSDLRRLLIKTANRSILVVEDIDCTLELENRKAKEKSSKILESNQVSQAQTANIVRQGKPNRVTLSGLLNFIDGLWSSCGDERIIIFTTNYKDRLDPALLRPGRMDMHIFMSYCTPCAFKTLAANYLRISGHFLYPEINSLLKKTKVTPAEIGEQLLRNEEIDIALQGVVQFLEKKREEQEREEEKQSVENIIGVDH